LLETETVEAEVVDEVAAVTEVDEVADEAEDEVTREAADEVEAEVADEVEAVIEVDEAVVEVEEAEADDLTTIKNDKIDIKKTYRTI